MKVTRVLLNIMSVICFIYGALYCFSLVFIPVGIYCFIAGKRFSYKAEHLFDEFGVNNNTIKNYTIFVCIACFPFGLLSLIPCYMLVSGKAGNTSFKATRITEVENEENKEEVSETKSEEEKPEEDSEKQEKQPEVQVEAQTMNDVSGEEKFEKLRKLKNFKEKGIITEDEFEMARKQLFGDDDK